MSNSTEKYSRRIQSKRDYEVNWQKAENFTPLDGEQIVYKAEVDKEGKAIVDAQDFSHYLTGYPNGRTAPISYPRIKIGDGETNVNDLPFIQGGAIGEEYLGGGEIFNDYENNQALSEYSHAEGHNACAGAKVFSFNEEYYANTANDFTADRINGTEGWYHLNSVEGLAEILGAEKPTYTVLLTNNYDFNGTIQEVDTTNNKIRVTNFLMPNETNVSGQKLRTVAEYGIDRSYIMLVDHTDVGDVITGDYTHAEGEGTIAAARAAHAEGRDTKAVGKHSHAEGRGTIAAYCGHAEGNKSKALADSSHAEGSSTTATGVASHTEGSKTQATEFAAHAEGENSKAIAYGAHAEGINTTASKNASHAEGTSTKASEINAHAEGNSTEASGQASHAEGKDTAASGNFSHTEGNNTTASKEASHAEGYFTTASGQYSHAEGSNAQADGQSSHAEGISTEAMDQASHAEGYDTHATHPYAHAEGQGSQATNKASHAEGLGTTASGISSHAEGYEAKANGPASHAEGNNTTASGDYSHAEGHSTIASNFYAHAEGYATTASGINAHAEGQYTKAGSRASHAEGISTEATGQASHAEGNSTIASETGTHAEGISTEASGEASHAEGYGTKATGAQSHAEGNGTVASGIYSHAEGESSQASGRASHAEGAGKAGGYYSHAEGIQTKANSQASHAEGFKAEALKDSSHAEGMQTKANGQASHAEGSGTETLGTASHAEGNGTVASGIYSHAEGENSQATGQASHAEGKDTQATQSAAHAEGDSSKATAYFAHAEGKGTEASGAASHAEGFKTIASKDTAHAGGYASEANHIASISHGMGVKSSADYQANFGKYNALDPDALLTVGMGDDTDHRHNALTVKKDGRVAVYKNPTDSMDVTTKEYVDSSVLDVKETADDALSIAKGANRAETFDNVDQMNAWINTKKEEVEADSVTGKTFPAGSTLIYSVDDEPEGHLIDGASLVALVSLNNDEHLMGASAKQGRAYCWFYLTEETYIESFEAQIIYGNGTDQVYCTENPRLTYVEGSVGDDDINYDLIKSHNIAVGTNLYIRDVGVPDYWWDGTQAQELETQKVDLTEYAKKEFVGTYVFNSNNIENGAVTLEKLADEVKAIINDYEERIAKLEAAQPGYITVASIEELNNTTAEDGTIAIIVNLISFTIDGTSYQAEEGMTWAEWFNSDYNTDDYSYGNPNYNIRLDNVQITETDLIVANGAYVTVGGGSD